jgi:hypothetical protein
MLTWNTLAATAVTSLFAGVLLLAPGAASAEEDEMDFGDEEGGNETTTPEDVELEEEPVEPEPPRAAGPEAPAGQPAYAFAMATDTSLAEITRELDSALRDLLASDQRFSSTNADNLLNGLDSHVLEELAHARELYEEGRAAYLNLDLEQASRLFAQVLQVYEAQVAHVSDLNLFSDCLLYTGATEVLSGNLRQAGTAFTRLLVIDPERRPDPDVFPPPVVEAYEYTMGRMRGAAEGVLEVTSTPEGADLFIDGVFQGPTPQALSGLKAGRHYVRVRRQGFVEAGQVVEVSGRGPSRVALNLQPTAEGESVAAMVLELANTISGPTDQLQDVIQRLGAELEIDVLLTALVSRTADGIHVQINVWDAARGVSLARQAAGPFEADPIVVAGDTPLVAQNALTAAFTALNVPQAVDEPLPPPLEPEPEPPPPTPRRPFWRQWWFWTAVGVVVVGAGVGVGLGVGLSNQEPGATNGEVIFDL